MPRFGLAPFGCALAALACGAPASPPPEELTTPDSAPSRCTVTPARADCTHQTLVLSASGVTREVHWQTPLGSAPAGGWPAAILFQGSTFSAERSWAATTTDPWGAYFQTLVVKRLLDTGFAVLSPEARDDGAAWWDTNQLAYASSWDAAPDAKVMAGLFEHLAAGAFGPLDAAHLYAAGISSGGYMTSRMALSYAGKFRALAIQSASWATCGGAWCALPAHLPADHPPTLFLHGQQDSVVPYGTMTPYEAQLRAEGHETKLVVSQTAGHAWLAEAPEAVAAWFSAHR